MIPSSQRMPAARARVFLLALCLLPVIPAFGQGVPSNEGTGKSIPFGQLGAEAQKQYSGDGISITPTADGARLRAAFQKLEGQATHEGLWLESAAEATGTPERFRVLATSVGRGDSPPPPTLLPLRGSVRSDTKSATFARPGLIEEYSVSMDGVRQDFLILERPAGKGSLSVTLEVTGAQVATTPSGVKLTLPQSGREIAYSRLHVTDSQGRKLAARFKQTSPTRLSILVDDAEATYPVRIDPTFSDADWSNVGGIPGASSTVYATTVDPAGNVYIGGRFTVAGEVIVNGIAKWNGSAWSALGSGIGDADIFSRVSCLAVSGTDLYAGGTFTLMGGVSANGIAKWDGSAWSALGSGVDGGFGIVSCLAVSGADLYAGGHFTTAGGVSANYIAKWNGSAWSALGSGVNAGGDGWVYALAVSGTDLYAGGDFTTAGGVSTNYLAKWNGSAWSALGSGMDSFVSTLAVSGTDLYAGGYFTTAGGVSANRIAKWNGSAWSALGTGMNELVSCLAVSGTDLYAGGQFTMAGGVGVNYIAKWNGSAWSPLGSGVDAYVPDAGVFGSHVEALAVSGTTLYAGGWFIQVGGVGTKFIAKWEGSAWSALGSGVDASGHDGGGYGGVSCLAISGTDIYAGVDGEGYFTTVSGVSANFIAKWNGSVWSTLGSGMNGGVHCLAVSGTDLYSGGDFTTVSGVSANYIARWNGSTWSPLGSGMNGRVSALAVSGTDLYAGGIFSTSGGVGASHIAKWNGSAWSALGSGMNDRVTALAVSGTDLYAAGWFYLAGGVGANYIAKWNGSAWSPLGSGMDWPVFTLAVSGTDLYAGGDFNTAGGVSANYIAKWDGSAWSPLGSGMNGMVYALAVSGTDLYAGGWFGTAGGVGANNIAKWDGSAWSALGSGMDAEVSALAVSGTDLYAGGGFSTAGGKAAPFVARGNLAGAPPNPAVTTSAASTVTPNTALLNGTVNANNLSTTVTFEYGLTTAYGSTVIATPSPVTGSSVTPVSASLTALLPNTTYHYRTKGVSAAGTSYGSDIAFTTAAAQPGDVEVGFNPVIAGDHISATALQPDGKLIIAGMFTSVNGAARNNVARLNADGSLDTGFDPNSNGSVNCVVVQADGGILLGGSFTTLQPNGAASPTVRNYLARIDSTGSLDTSFDPRPNNTILNIALQADGKILLGGNFTTLQPNGAVSATARQRIARVNSDGTLDTGFDPKASSTVWSIAEQADGKIVFGGLFTTVQPNGAVSSTIRNRIARVNADGTLDTGFDPNPDSHVTTITIQADGKLLIGGWFTTLQPNGAAGPTTRRYVARLNLDGTLDTGFDPNPDLNVYSIVTQADGKILMGGQFFNLQPNGAATPTVRSKFARVHANGTLDTSFNPKPNGSVYGIEVQSDGKILLSGDFTTLQPNGAPSTISRHKFARLNNDSASQSLSAPDSGRVVWSRGGSSPELTQVTFEQSTNGSNWTSLGMASRVGTSSDWQLAGLSLPVSGELRATGRGASGFANGSSGLVQTVSGYSILPTVTTLPATSLTSSTATLNGTVNPNGYAATVTFEYGLTDSYGSSVSATLAPVGGSGALAVSAVLSGLTPETTYHFRIKGVNAGGAAHGGDQTFTTLSTRYAPNQLLHSIPAPAVGTQTGTEFGTSVAVDGGYTVVGAPRDDAGATDAGVVKVFNSTTGALLFLLPNPTPAATDLFGYSVAISGTRVVVGAIGDDTGASNAGSAYVYDLSSATPTVPLLTVNNPGPAANDEFGYSVTISGRFAAVAAWQDDTGATNAGSVYVYDLDGSSATTPLLTLANPAPAATDQFGNSIHLSGIRLIIGAWRDDAGASDSGSAYVYDLTSATPTTPTVTLNNPGPAAGDLFGRSVGISGTRAVVGAREDDSLVSNAGIAYVYDLISGTPTVPAFTLDNPSPTIEDQFGTAVAISGTTVAVGAYLDDAGANDAGTIYVYDVGSGTPTIPAHTISNPASAALDWFGYSLALSGTRLVAGAYLDDTGATDAGSAYVYDLTGGTPTVPTAALNSPAPATGDWFGTRIGLSGNLLVVGASREDTGAQDAGSVYVYDLAGGTPTTPAYTLHNPSPASSDQFGYSVAISGTRVVVGAWWDDAGASDAGVAYIYDLSSASPTVPIHTLTNPTPAGDDYFGWAVAISGTQVVIGAYQDDTGATNAGSAYVYDLASATPTVPLATLNNPDPASNDWFGYSVAVSGPRFIVGAHQDDTGATDSGSAYVYDLTSGTPTVPAQTFANPAPFLNDQFGFSVAISGRRVVVSANADDGGGTNAGSAYVYDLSSGTPTVPAYTLSKILPVAGDDFGYSVAISGTRIVVGADGDATGGASSGRAFLFDLTSSDPTRPLATFDNPTPATLDAFGYSVAVDGELSAVSAYLDDTTAVDKGAAYVFGPNTTPEIEVAILGGETLTDAASTLNFGYNPVGVASQRILSVKNLSSVPLTGLGLTKDGVNAADFTLGALGSATLAPGASTSFSVTFSPSAAAARLAALHLTSNDSNESPFDITLTGSGQPGGVDPTFDPQVIGGYVYDSIELPDGKILIGGEFLTVGGQVQPNLARLNADGTLDTGFAVTVSGMVTSLAQQADGKLLVGGSYTITSGGQSRTYLARLNTDGTLDTSLPSLGINSTVSAVVCQADGKIVIGGFLTTVLGQTRNYIARINADGTLDAGYNLNLNQSVDAMALQSDGTVVIGGQFTTVGGITRNRLARINTDGTLDSAFNPNVNSRVEALAIQSDNKILLGGTFTTVGGTTRNRLARVYADGTLDTGYNPNLNGSSYDIALQSDGKAIVGGAFTTVGGGVSRDRIVRILTDGGIDASFNPGSDGAVTTTSVLADGRILVGGRFSRVGGLVRNLVAILGADGTPAAGAGSDVRGGGPFALSVQPDGKTLVGGTHMAAGPQPQAGLSRLLANGAADTSFTSSQGVEFWTYATLPLGDGRFLFNRINSIARANADGSLDSTFTSLSAGSSIYALAMQTDGKVVVAGLFTTLGGQTRNRLARINADGTLDSGFNPNANGTVYALAVQTDGKIIVGGDFTTVGGVTRNRIARLNADGSLDTGFDPNASANVLALSIQPNGSILIGGNFTTLSGATRGRIARLSSSGALEAFNPTANNTVTALSLQANGQVLAGGAFTTVGGVTRNRLARLQPDGAPDESFFADFDGPLSCLTMTADGQVLAGGAFSRVNGVAGNGLVRVANAPAMQSLTANSGGTVVTWVRAGASPEVDRVTFESSLDGATWSNLGNGTRTTSGWQLTGLALPSGQSYRVRARGWQMTGGQLGGDSSIYETVALMPAGSGPEIVVEQTAGAALTDAASTSDFGSVNLGAAGDVSYAIYNTGTADLTGLAIIIDGPHASDFSLASSPAPAIPAGGSTTFTVRFAAGSPGLRYASLHLHSNDGDESPFDISLSGSGQFSGSSAGVANVVGGFVREFARQADGKLWVGGNFDQIGGGVRTDLARLNADGTLDASVTTSMANWVEALLLQADGKLVYDNNGLLRRRNADGTVDTSFTPNASSTIYALGQQADGKLIVGGGFTTLAGQACNRLGRLNLDGTFDASFNPDVSGTVEIILVQPDDKILIGGSFTTIGGVTRNRIARLNADGTLDTGFDPNASGTVFALVFQADGKLLLGGSFTTIGGVTRNRIARLKVDGSLDTGFDANASSTVNSIAIQPDQRLIIGGAFTTVGGVARNRIARINADSTLDATFNPDINNTVSAVSLNADGSVMVGGFFTTVGGVTRNRLARIQANGSLDTSLDPNCNGAIIYATVQQPDGKTLVAGWFTHVNDVARNHIARLNADGSLDTSFNPNSNGEIYSIAYQPDGMIIVGGLFTSMGGVTRNRIARLHPNGTLDTAFNPNASDYVFAIVVEPAGTILIGGLFTTVGGTARNRMARLNADGTLDTSFDPNVSSTVYSIASQPDGKVLVGGNFSTVGGSSRVGLARLNSNGTVDPGFNANLGGATIYGVQTEANGGLIIHGFLTTVGGVSQPGLARLNSDGTLVPAFNPVPNSGITSLSRHADGSMALAGYFTSITKAGIAYPRNRLALLGADGQVSASFDPDANYSVHTLASTGQGRLLMGGLHSALGGVSVPKIVRLNPGAPAMQSLGVNATATIVTWARGGSSPEVDRVTFESSADGSTWSSLGNGARSGAGWQLTGLSLPAGQENYLRARGYQMTGGFYGGDGSAYETVARVSASGAAAPEIVVEQPVDTGLFGGVSEIDFGEAQATGSNDLTFTIKNSGAAPLAGLAVTFEGGEAADYSVVTAPTASVAALTGSTTFTVRFAPGDSGPRPTVLRIWSNDADENPFDISLTGTGLASPPSATTLAATVIHSSAATLRGSVSANGADTAISFDYGYSTSYGFFTAATPATLGGGSASAVSAVISGLAPNITYHFRVRATNSAGTTLGDDMTFTTPASAPGEVNVLFDLQTTGTVVRATAMQPDRKMLVGGTFSSMAGTTRNGLARLLAHGALDEDFDPNLNGTVNCVAVQEDGSCLVGGTFTTVGGVARNRIARLNADGTLDMGFNPNANGSILSFVLLPDGRILVGGSFTTIGGVTRNRIALLNADGTLDGTFDPNASNTVRCILPEPDGGFLVAGDFTSIGGQTRNRIARLNADGSLDATFNPDADNAVISLTRQVDGKILAGGNFTTMGGLSSVRLARLNADGSVDAGFLAGGMNNSVNSLLLQADGKILAGGWFTTVGGVTRNRVARLNSDGTLDTAFNPNSNNIVDGMALQADGRLVLGGTFTMVGGQPLNYLARLENDPATQSLTVPSPGRIEWLRGGSAPEAQDVTFEISTDGGLNYTLLGGGVRISGGWELTGLTLPLRGQVRARARTLGGYFNGSSGFVESITAIPPAGSVDLAFDPAADSWIDMMAEQRDGKIIIAGTFTTVGGVARNKLARVHADGSLDPTFDIGSGPNNYIWQIAMQADGKILVVGSFTTFNGQSRAGIVRLNVDGSVDTGFNVDPGLSSGIYTLLPEADGRILIGGGGFLVRLNPDGSVDSAFAPSIAGGVYAAALQPDGKIVIGGNITSVNGAPRNRLARLYADGSLEDTATFDPGDGPNGHVGSLLVQPDGKILVSGTFWAVSGQSRPGIARLNPDGSVESSASFDLGTGALGFPFWWELALGLQADGKIIVAGDFYAFNGQPRNGIARLNGDGSLEDLSSFEGSGLPVGFHPAASLVLRADGSILLGGFPHLVDEGWSYGTALHNNPASEALTVPDAGSVRWLRGGGAPELSWATFEISDDGATWAPLGTGQRIPGGWELTGLSLPTSGYLRASGLVKSFGGFRRSSSIVESLATFGSLDQPQIAVYDGSGTAPANQRADDAGVFTMAGTVGSSQTFTIQNIGTLDLSGLSLTFTGTHAADFSVETPPTATLVPGDSTTFQIRFTPGSSGAKTATLHIASNVFGLANPFSIRLAGTGLGSLTTDNYSNRLNLGNAMTVDVTGSNVGATLESGESTFGGTMGASVWAEWTAPASGWFTVHTAGSRLDTVIGLYTGGGSLAGLNLMGHNDESQRPGDMNYFNQPWGISRLVFYAQAGTTYSIALGGWDYGSGPDTDTFELHIAAEPPPPVRVMGVSFSPGSVDVTNAAQTTAMQVSVDSDSALFTDGYFSANIFRPGGYNFNQLYNFFQDTDRVSGTTTSGVYEQSFQIPRYVPAGDWPVLVRAFWGTENYQWSTAGDDLIQDFYLIPAPVNAPLEVANSGIVDEDPPVLVSVTGFPASVDVTAGDVTFEVDITVTDDLSGFDSASLSIFDGFSGYGIESFDPGSFISGNPQGGVFRKTVTIRQGTASGMYFPEVWLRDTALNQRNYTDYNSFDPDAARISPPGSDLKIQVIGAEPEIGVKDPDNFNLTDGAAEVNFGTSIPARTAAFYDFSGNFAGEFSEYLNTGTGAAVQSGGALKYSTSATAGDSAARFLHNTFHPTYNQSWSVEAEVTLPLGLESSLPPDSPFIDNGLVISFTRADGSVFRAHASLSVEPVRKYLAYHTETDPGGETHEYDYGYEVPTADPAGVVRIRFDATTKVLTAETNTHTLMRLNLVDAGWGMSAADTFSIGTEFSVGNATIPAATPIAMDNFRATLGATGVEKTFTITNTGVAPLHGMRLSKSGAHAADFILGDLLPSYVMPGASITFTVTFAPSTIGPRVATLHIISNDADENPFDIDLIGTGAVSAPPTALTLAATDLARTSASLNGLGNGNGSPTTVFFEYGLTSAYGATVGATPPSLTSGVDTAVSASITGLTPGTQYHFRVRAISTFGVTLGDDRTFTTPVYVAGGVDAAFDQGANGQVLAIATQADGKMLIGGSFTSLGGATRQRLARVNANGTLDGGFAPAINGVVNGIAVQPDGKVIIGGSFTQVNSVTRNRIARFNADGSLDLSFNPNLSSAVQQVLVRPDGKILISGSYNARLNADGTLDSGFNAAPLLWNVHGMTLQPDGKVILTGEFYPGQSNIIRLNDDGSVEDGFTPVAGNEVSCAAVQADGKILIGGRFTSLSGLTRNYLARLNDDGSPDTSFTPDLNGRVAAVTLQADGKIILAGDFTTINGVTRNRVARLTGNGEVDSTFNPNANASATILAIGGDGKVMVGGDFTVMGSFFTRNRLARLENDPATQTLTLAGTGRIEWLRSGTAPEAQWVTFEVSSNGGSTWMPLGAGSRISGGWVLNEASLPGAGLLRARAATTDSVSSSGIVAATSSYSGLPVPEISVFNGASTAPADERADNAGVFAFGPLLLNTGATRTFTIKNSGTAALTGLGISLGGSGQFTFTPPATETLAPNSTTTFTVTFFPTVEGLQSRTVLIASGDADENPFEIQVTGHGQIAPTVTLNPTSLFIGLGQAGSLTVGGTGTALEYQWYHNGLPVPGATSATHAIPSAGMGHAGVWSARVFNGVGFKPSAAAHVGVVDQRTSAKSADAGSTLTLNVTGAAPGGTYRWLKGGVAVPRGINPETKLVLAGIRPDQAGAYSCEITMPDPEDPGNPLRIESGIITVTVNTTPGTSGATLPTRPERPIMQPFKPGPWIVGGEVKETLAALNVPTRFSVTGLPAGVRLDAASGRITGVPTLALTAPRRFSLTISASNAAGTCLTPLKTEVWVQPLPGYSTGTFTGLITRHATLNGDLGGRLTLTVGATGSYTGRITLGAVSHALTGQVKNVVIGQDIATQATIRRAGKQPALQLAFAINRLTGELTGTLAEGSDAGAEVGAWRSLGTGSGYEGRREVELFDMEIGASSHGALRITVATSGATTWAGVLPDGATLTGSSPLCLPGSVPTHGLLYRNTGSVQGWLSPLPASGRLDWLRNPTLANPGFPLRTLEVR